MRAASLLNGLLTVFAMTLWACAPAPTGSVDSKTETRSGDSAAMSAASIPPASVSSVPQLPETKTLNKVWFRYARGACLGPCPQYEVTVEVDGRFTATGFRHVSRLGEFSGQFSAAHLEVLRQQLITVQALQKKWPNGQPPCTVQVSDQSELRIESGALKLQWSGCEGFADHAAFEQAVAAIDAIVQATLFDNTR